ncbi:hypothetical protein GTQ34_05380 [Muricauda sp. JGD-17]|uniref:Uncharacterized protein n=1 Tax=Flagellimonas ochracea TaxID=2696472 RepID=A0A964WWT6_9FLAO|nr:hypothetical protein [Allomuricauda ochracea]NAY91345.1 hypothetical protein [Allomuricauda ochracea]
MKGSNRIYNKGFTPRHRAMGRFSSWAVCILLLIYMVTTALGLLSLESSDDPIGDPYFTLMEIFTLLIAPLMLIGMSTVHAYAALEDKMFSRIALLCMAVMAGITSCVHFTVLTLDFPVGDNSSEWQRMLFSFRWPSMVYALDILARDWFFALSMLFAAPVFKTGNLEKAVRMLMVISGVLSLAGLIGVPLDNMELRNIGILGYTLVAASVFMLMGFVFNRKTNTT